MKEDLIKYDQDLNFIDLVSSHIKEFKNKNKIILFIEPYGASLSLIKRGFENDYQIIILTANTDLRKVPIDILRVAMLSIQVDTANEKKILNLIAVLNKVVKIDAVIPGFEYFVPIAAKVSYFLQVPGIEPEHVLFLRRKNLMREALKNKNIRIPKYCHVKSMNDLDCAIETVGFPAVCKPVDAAGSVNVIKVENKVDFIHAAERILLKSDVLWGYPLSNELLLEEYIEGKEYSIEGIIHNKKVTYFSITEKFVSNQIDFIEIGHIVNSPLPDHLKNNIQLYINQVIDALGADHCPFHAEIRLNQDHEPVLMEIAARLAGDKIGDLINLSRSANYFDYVYAAYLGEDLLLEDHPVFFSGIRFFYRPDINQYKQVNGVELAKQYPIEDIAIYYSPTTFIPDFPKPLRRLGHVIAKHHDYDQLVDMLDDIDRHIVFSS